jgi:hypothetical protein
MNHGAGRTAKELKMSEITVYGETLKLNGKAGVSYLGKDRIVFSVKYESLSFDGLVLSFDEKTPNDVIKHEIDNIESVSVYDKAVYIYGHNIYNGNKTRVVLDRA